MQITFLFYYTMVIFRSNICVNFNGKRDTTAGLGDDIVISFINIPLYLYLYLCVCFVYYQFTLYIILYIRNSRTLSNHMV